MFFRLINSLISRPIRFNLKKKLESKSKKQSVHTDKDRKELEIVEHLKSVEELCKQHQTDHQNVKKLIIKIFANTLY